MLPELLSEQKMLLTRPESLSFKYAPMAHSAHYCTVLAFSDIMNFEANIDSFVVSFSEV